MTDDLDADAVVAAEPPRPPLHLTMTLVCDTAERATDTLESLAEQLAEAPQNTTGVVVIDRAGPDFELHARFEHQARA